MNNQQFPVFADFSRPLKNTKVCRNITLQEAIERTRSGFFQKLTEEARNRYEVYLKAGVESAKDSYTQYKRKNGYYSTVSCTFKPDTTRANENVATHSGLFQIDVDKSKECVCDLRFRVRNNKEIDIAGDTYSLSGHGCKIFVYVEGATIENHPQIYSALIKYFNTVLKVPVDESCKDIARACIWCWDRTAYYNADFLNDPRAKWDWTKYLPQEKTMTNDTCHCHNTLEVPKDTQTYQQKYVKAFRIADFLWQNNISLLDGYDEYIACVAGIAHDLGEKGYQIARDISAVSKKFDPKEFDKTWKSLLNNPREEGENCATLGTLFTLAENNGWISNEEQYKYVCPTLERIVERLTGLPTLVEELVSRATTKSEKVVTFVSVVGAISSVLPNCFFMHGEKGNRMTKYPNLAVILLGPSGCGKRMMRLGREVISSINNTVIENSPQNKDQRLKWSVIEPAKVTEAKFITDLEYNQTNINNGSMCIFATEMDSLSKTKKGEHGLSSDILRACAEHEPVEKKVKGMPRDYVREAQGEIILEPKVTQVLTGTFDQVFNFFSNNTDGEMGRYMIINLERESKFISGIESEEDDDCEESILEVAKQLGEKYLYKGWEALVNRDGRVRFRCTNEQKKYHDELFKPLKDQWEIVSEGFSDFTHRLSPNARKIAMVLTILRYWEREEYDLPAVIYPTDEDWKLAVDCAIDILGHMYYVYSQPRFNRQRVSSTQGPSWQDIYKQMGDTFTRSEFDEACLKAGVRSNTASQWICRLTKQNLIFKQASGDVYNKNV